MKTRATSRLCLNPPRCLLSVLDLLRSQQDDDEALSDTEKLGRVDLISKLGLRASLIDESNSFASWSSGHLLDYFDFEFD